MNNYKKIINDFVNLFQLGILTAKDIKQCSYDYDNLNDNYNYVISHCFNFTALMWKNSLYYGIGYAYVNGKISICILLSQKGNIQNEYSINHEQLVELLEKMEIK